MLHLINSLAHNTGECQSKPKNRFNLNSFRISRLVNFRYSASGGSGLRGNRGEFHVKCDQDLQISYPRG
jgi:hypothetical protein